MINSGDTMQNMSMNSIVNRAHCLISKNLKIKIYRTVIMPVVLYGCETWSLTLGEEHRLRVFENGVLMIFGPKREEDGSWRKSHNDGTS
jgi:hypothetical protein